MTIPKLLKLAKYHGDQAERFRGFAASFTSGGHTAASREAQVAAEFHQQAADEINELAEAFRLFGHPMAKAS